MVRYVLVMGLILALTSSALASDPKITQDPRSLAGKLAKSGEQFISQSYAVRGSDVRAGLVYAIIDAPAAHAHQILRDYGSYRHFLPFFKQSKVLQRNGSQATLKLRASIVKGTVKIKATAKASEQKTAYDGTLFQIKLLKGNIKHLNALFRVYALDDKRCIVAAAMMLDPDLWFVRDSTLSGYNQVNSRRTLRSFRKRLKQIPYRAPTPPAAPAVKVQPASATSPNAEATNTGADEAKTIQPIHAAPDSP
jgi:ribosome-associated toxin RatA of RatAB toxin-antitoxin module